MLLRPLVAGCGAAVLTVSLTVTSPVGVASADGDDPYRPQVHFSPAQNWVNDPNGPVWYDGEYHLFYQYNPAGDQWGNMSWGHAVSTDLVHWEELPVAIPFSEQEHIFSGTVVVDEQNTTGFGTDGRPAMVAVYTSYYPESRIQAQSLAYSTDRGRTWTKYEGNPVLDLGSTEFRDPKVFWYEDGGYWVMAVALSTERRIQLYRSDDLVDWTHMSDFGPANAVGGVWEMPDLFELPVDGDTGRTKWVMVVNLNPGSIAGGSGAQYFVGEFDGTRFVAENVDADDYLPEGTVFEDFEGGAYGPGWTTTGTSFGDAPATGTLPGQMPVDDFLGGGLVNSFADFDRSQGTLTSPEFTVTQDYVNLLVGGGRHAWAPGSGDGSPPEGTVLADFEGEDFDGWSVTGDAFGNGPVDGDAPCQVAVTGYLGRGLANSFHAGDPDACDARPDSGTGTLTSPAFVIGEQDHHISFLVGGGPHATTAVRLLVEGEPEPARSTSGRQSGALNWASWDVSDLAGRTARIEILDAEPGDWGHVMADHFVLGGEPAVPRSAATAVNLLVDGEVVRTASGDDSERLDWVAWDVRELAGRSARIEVVDHNSGGWGHVLADHIMFADEPARAALERYSWLDYGADMYAALTFENVPGDRRIAIGWMSNWQYASRTPTVGWRGAMTLPRELRLETVDGVVRLVQEPVHQLTCLRTTWSGYRLRDRVVGPGVTQLPARAEGTVLEIRAEFEVGSAREFGLQVRAGQDERTVIGYDTAAEELFVDRTVSGDVDFHPAFATVKSGPLSTDRGRVRITAYVDRSSVEVFGGAGQTVLTETVFPDLSSDGVSLYAEGGNVTVRSLTVRPLSSSVP